MPTKVTRQAPLWNLIPPDDAWMTDYSQPAPLPEPLLAWTGGEARRFAARRLGLRRLPAGYRMEVVEE